MRRASLSNTILKRCPSVICSPGCDCWIATFQGWTTKLRTCCLRLASNDVDHKLWILWRVSATKCNGLSGMHKSPCSSLMASRGESQPGSQNLIQISAPVSPGSSGSPVFDLNGKVIAVTVAQYHEGQNLNFAIPIETVSELRKQEYNLNFDEFRTMVAMGDGKGSGSPVRGASPAGTRIRALDGLYSGIVSNQTANLSASFVVLVHESEGFLSGCVGVREPLYGSGPLRGTVQGSRVLFAVDRPDFALSFEGRLRGKKILGSYLVSATNGSSQRGRFYVERYDEAPPLTGTCPTDAEMNSKNTGQ